MQKKRRKRRPEFEDEGEDGAGRCGRRRTMCSPPADCWSSVRRRSIHAGRQLQLRRTGRLERRPGFPARGLGLCDCRPCGNKRGEVFPCHSVRCRRDLVLIRPDQCVGQDLEANCRTLLNRDVMLHKQRHICLHGEQHHAWQIGQTRLCKNALKMKASEAGLLSKTHVNQLHPLPHLRAALRHFLPDCVVPG